MWWLFVIACAHRDQEDPQGPIPGLLARADAAWRDRATGGMEPVEAALTEAWQADPGHAGVRWRLARAQVERALELAEPEAAADGYSAARALAIACVQRGQEFEQAVAAEGWTAAVAGLPPNRVPCAAWAGIAWTRWLGTKGTAGTALDLPAVDALLGTASLAAQDEPAKWASDMLLAIRPVWDGRDLVAAEKRLVAPREGPNAWVYAVDRLQYVLIPMATDPSTLRPLTADVAETGPLETGAPVTGPAGTDTAAVAELCAWLERPPQGLHTAADRGARERGLVLCGLKEPPTPDPQAESPLVVPPPLDRTAEGKTPEEQPKEKSSTDAEDPELKGLDEPEREKTQPVPEDRDRLPDAAPPVEPPP